MHKIVVLSYYSTFN